MKIELAHAWVLVALALAPILWWAARRTLTDFSRAQLRLMNALRIAIFALLALALAAPTLVHRSSRVSLTMLVDVSPSMSDESLARTDALAKRLVERADVPLRVIVFDRSPRLVCEGSGPIDSDRPLIVRPPADNAPVGTDVDSALRFARAGLPTGYVGRIALITDGRQVSGSSLQAPGTAEEATTPTETIVLVPPKGSKPEVLVASLEIAGKQTPGATVELRTRVLADRGGLATLAVYVDGFRIGDPKPVTLVEGENLIVTPVRLGRSGSQTYSVRLSSELDTYPGNNAASQVVVLPSELKVLLVEQSEDDARFLARVLRDGGLDVEVRSAAGFPTQMMDLDRFACVVLSDVPASMLTIEQMRMTKNWVEDLGGGLVMIGGEDSFGLGGWFATPVEDVLPVRLDVEKKKEQPTLAMMMLLDKSGSMQDEKIKLAKDAARAALEMLGPDDLVGIVTFDAEAHLVMAPQAATNRALIATTLSSVVAGGGTNIYPAIGMAQRELRRVEARLKHVILLTDGQTAGGDYRSLVSRLAGDRITVSTVAVGVQADVALLKDIARWGRGRFHFTQDAFSIPQIFARETMTASRSAVVEGPFRPRVVREADVVSGLDLTSAPYLLGYVATRPKPAMELILATERAEPLLVRGRFGLGKSVAFTSDAKNRWAAEWMSWPGFGKMWTQIVRDAMRPRPAGACDTRISFIDDAGRIDIVATDSVGRFRNRLEAAASVLAPDGSAMSVPLRQVAPGRYRGDFPAAQGGTWIVSAKLSHGASDDRAEMVVSGRVKPEPAEFVALDADRDALARLVEFEGAGGALVEADDWADPDATVAMLTAPGHQSVAVSRPLAPALLWCAFALFFVDLLLRRVDLRNLRRKAAISLILITCATAGLPGRTIAAGLPGAFSTDAELIVLRERRATAVELLARMQMSSGKLDEAKTLLAAERERILRTTAETALTIPDATLLCLLAVAEEMSGNAERRDALFGEVDRLSPKVEMFHLELASAFDDLHREDIFEREAAKVLALPPDDSSADLHALNLMSVNDMTNRNYIRGAERAGKLDAMVRRQIAANIKEGYVEEVELRPLVAEAYALFEKETDADRARALDLCEKVWQRAPWRIDAVVLGEKLSAAERSETPAKTWRERADAVAARYRQEIRRDWRDVNALNGLAWLCAERGCDLDEGIDAVERALRLRPEEAPFIDTLAELQFRKGNAAAAAKTISRVIDSSPWANDYYRRQLDRFRKAAEAVAKDGAP